jgi:hypothetical protein
MTRLAGAFACPGQKKKGLLDVDKPERPAIEALGQRTRA